MKDYEQIYRECFWALEDIGLHPNFFRSIFIRDLGMDAFALCHCSHDTPEPRFFLTLSPTLVRDEAPDVAIRSVMMHELIHTMDHAFDHGKTWSAYADYASRYFPDLVIQESADWHALGIRPTHKPDYAIRCVNCGKYYFLSKTEFSPAELGAYCCSSCGGDVELVDVEEAMAGLI